MAKRQEEISAEREEIDKKRKQLTKKKPQDKEDGRKRSGNASNNASTSAAADAQGGLNNGTAAASTSEETTFIKPPPRDALTPQEHIMIFSLYQLVARASLEENVRNSLRSPSQHYFLLKWNRYECGGIFILGSNIVSIRK